MQQAPFLMTLDVSAQDRTCDNPFPRADILFIVFVELKKGELPSKLIN